MERLSRPLFWAVLVMAGYYALFGGRYSIFEVRAAAQDREVLEVRLDSLRDVNEGLDARIEALEHDPELLERVAREEYGMVAPGEILYRHPEPDDTLSSGGPD